MEDKSKTMYQQFMETELSVLTDHELELVIELEKNPGFEILVSKVFYSIQEKLKMLALMEVPHGDTALITHGHRQGQITNMEFVKHIAASARLKLDSNKKKATIKSK